jgi:quinohemoprotein ethanol dehydrogenase
VAVWKGRVYVGALDGRLIALEAETGEPVWQVQTTDPSKPYTITGAPRVVKDLVVIGNGGAEFGVRGYFSAYDAATGALRWRFYTVPRKPDGPQEHPELERALETWSPDTAWEWGLGGTVWDSMAYDPELDLLYVGVGNSSPYDREVRSPGGGDNLFLASILAVRPETGRLVWHYQTTPAESWDYTATQHIVLAELELGGRQRSVLMQAPKNGFFYVLDRASGELLSAEPYVSTSWASHVDLATGRPVETGRADWHDEPRLVLPSIAGGHNWHPMAFHPGTGLVYIPTYDFPYLFRAAERAEYRPGEMNTGEDFVGLAAAIDGFERTLRFCDATHLTAWDPVAGRRVWRTSFRSEIHGGALATGADLVFHGSGDGRLVAYHASDGRELWASDVGIALMAGPVSYELDGEQYVVAVAGAGGSAGLNLTMLDYQNAGYVIAYKRGGKAELPEVQPRKERVPDPPPRPADAGTVARGAALYARHCFRCHGVGTKSGGLLPDLRRSTREIHDAWPAIVRQGALAGRGMPGFADLLSSADVEAIHAYVIRQALREPSLVESAAAWLGRYACIPAGWIVD